MRGILGLRQPRWCMRRVIATLVLMLASLGAQAQVAISTVTQPASATTRTSATLNGSVNGNGEDISAVYFDWGPVLPYAQTFANATPFSVIASQGQTAVSLALSGLACGTTYHFRVTADDSNGRNGQGGDMTFATLACAVPPAAVPTLSPWGLLALAALIAGAAWLQRRRSRTH